MLVDGRCGHQPGPLSSSSWHQASCQASSWGHPKTSSPTKASSDQKNDCKKDEMFVLSAIQFWNGLLPSRNWQTFIAFCWIGNQGSKRWRKAPQVKLVVKPWNKGLVLCQPLVPYPCGPVASFYPKELSFKPRMNANHRCWGPTIGTDLTAVLTRGWNVGC